MEVGLIMTQWNASNYRANKAKRLQEVKPEWVVNPETKEKFLLRRVGAMASMLAGYMPHNLTNKAIKAWKEKGIEVEGETKVTPQQAADGEKELQMMAKIVHQACVLPKLVANPTADDELDPSELDDKDVMFIFRFATGQVNASGVPLVGGQVMPMGNLENFRKKPGRRIRTRNDGQELRDTA